MEGVEQALLRVAVKINHYISADDEVVQAGGGLVAQEVAPLKSHERPNDTGDGERLGRTEVASAQLVGRIAEVPLREFCTGGGGQTLTVDVRS